MSCYLALAMFLLFAPAPNLRPDALKQKSASVPTLCGHIRILPAPPDIDRGIVHQVPDMFSSHMPVLPGTPLCPIRPH